MNVHIIFLPAIHLHQFTHWQLFDFLICKWNRIHLLTNINSNDQRQYYKHQFLRPHSLKTVNCRQNISITLVDIHSLWEISLLSCESTWHESTEHLCDSFYVGNMGTCTVVLCHTLTSDGVASLFSTYTSSHTEYRGRSLG